MSAIVRPAYTVEVQFAAGVWTALGNLRGFHTRRGRQRELGTIEPGEPGARGVMARS